MPPPRRHIDELLIAHLAAGKTVREAARLAGCSEATAHRRLADPAFRQAVRRVRQKLIEALCGDLRKAATLAISTLEALLTSDEPMIRLRAADAILTHFRALHPEIGTEPEDEPPGQKRVELVCEIVDSTSDGSGQAVIDQIKSQTDNPLRLLDRPRS
jgi:phage terminase small subunit